ncbi:MAG: hypothetical protein RIG84_17765 [Roseovarius sp.]
MTSQFIESETEVSVAYPDAPEGLSTEAAAIPAAVIWDRLESWTNYRWSETVTDFVVNPPCEVKWQPPYAPFVVDSVDGETATIDGFGQVILRSKSVVRCTIGGATPTETVNAAYIRLAEYMAATDDAPGGVSRYSIDVGDISESWSRKADHMAKAIHNSGAADLLRRYRKSGTAYV